MHTDREKAGRKVILTPARFWVSIHTFRTIRGTLRWAMCICLCVCLIMSERVKHSQKTHKESAHRKRCQWVKALDVPDKKHLRLWKNTCPLNKETTVYFWIPSYLKKIIHCLASFKINKIATISNVSSSCYGGMSLQDLEYQDSGSYIQILMRDLNISIDNID